MGRKNKRNDGKFWGSLDENISSYTLYYDMLTELAISMFEWKNIPDTIDVRFLELTLFSYGQAVFFKDEVVGYLALQNANMGNLDFYRIPTKRRAYAVNGYNRNLTDKDSVLIYNNNLHKNSMNVVQNFANRLWNLDRAIEVNANAQKTPVLIKCNEQQRLSLLNIYKEYDGNEPVIFGDSALNQKEAFTVLNTGAPYVADKLYTLKTQLWNEALTYLGISNVNFQKKERMISDEVTRSMGGVIANRQSRLQARRDAVDKINKMFGLEIEVNYKEDFRELDDEYMLTGDSGGEEVIKVANDLRSRSNYE